MSVALLLLEIRLPLSHSLKEKRRIIQSVFARIKKNFNVSIAEIESQDLWQKANIGIASINTSFPELNTTLNHIVNFIENFSEIEIMNYKIESL